MQLQNHGMHFSSAHNSLNRDSMISHRDGVSGCVFNALREALFHLPCSFPKNDISKTTMHSGSSAIWLFRPGQFCGQQLLETSSSCTEHGQQHAFHNKRLNKPREKNSESQKPRFKACEAGDKGRRLTDQDFTRIVKTEAFCKPCMQPANPVQIDIADILSQLKTKETTKYSTGSASQRT